MRPKKEAPENQTYDSDLSFRHGSIMQVMMSNFMCVDNLSYDFDPRLNFVVGPNGSGKSTLVCAIYICLNGDVKKLGRGSSLLHYINHARPEMPASVTVVLCEKRNNRTGTCTIKRRWNSNGKSEWSIDKRKVSEAAVKEKLLTMNTRVGNLLQFLPQEKVSEFNSMTDIQRLKCFQEVITVDGANLAKMHQDLIAEEESSKNGSSEIDEMRKELKDVETRAAQLEEQVMHYRERRKKELDFQFKQTYALILCEKEKKSQWQTQKVITEELKRQADAQRADLMQNIDIKLNVARKQLDKCKDKLKLATLDGPEVKKNLAKMVKAYTDMIGNVEGEVQKQIKILQRSKNLFNKGLIEIHRQKEDLVGYKRDEESKIEEYEANKGQWEAEMTKLERELKKIKSDKDAAEDKVDEVKSQFSKSCGMLEKLQADLAKQSDESQKRKKRLQRLLPSQEYNHVMRALDLIENNRDQFEQPIVLPILEISTSLEGSKVLLEHCSVNEMCNFVAQSYNDNKTLLQLIKPYKLPLSITYFDNSSELDVEYWMAKKIDPQENGFKSVLIDELEGNPVAICFLAKYCKVHMAPYLSTSPNDKEAFKNDLVDAGFRNLTHYILDEMMARKYKEMIYSADLDVAETSSNMKRWDDQIYRLFQQANQDTEQNQLEESIQLYTNDCQKKKSQYEIAKNKFNQLDDAYKGKHKRRTDIVRKLKQAPGKSLRIENHRKQIQNKVNELPNIVQDQINFKNEIANIQKSFLKNYEKFITFYGMALTPALALQGGEAVKFAILKKNLEQRKVEKEEQLQDIQKQVTDLEEELQIAEGAYNFQVQKTLDAKKTLLELEPTLTDARIKQTLKEMAPPISEPRNNRDKRAMQEWRRRCMNELNAQLETEERVLEALIAETADVTAQMERNYENTKKEVERQTKRLENRQRERQNQKARCDELKQKWLPVLQAQVDNVSKNLSKHFGRIGCDGKVVIGIPEDPEQYSKYELYIRVRFREGMPLQDLAIGRQSGGERSVATMLFLLSMPPAHTPFRLVDEINQGMDQQNERNVLDVLGQVVSSEDDCCQFFVITPKLLMGIDYPDNSKVIIVHNTENPFPKKMSQTQECIEIIRDIGAADDDEEGSDENEP